MPARLRWSSRASPIGAVGLARRSAQRPRPRPSRARAGRGRGGRPGRPRCSRGTSSTMPSGSRRPLRRSVSSTTRAVWAGPAPALARARDVPAALHLEVGVEGPGALVGVDPGEQVLAARDGLDDRARRRGRGGEARAPGSRCAVRPWPLRARSSARGRAVDGVALRHRNHAASAPWRRDEAGGVERLAQRRRAAAPRSCSPSAFSTVSRPSAPRRAASASDCGRRGEQRRRRRSRSAASAAALDVER